MLTRHFIISLLLLSACDTVETGDLRAELRDAYVRGDGSYEELSRGVCSDAGMAEGCDVCDVLDYYADGVCDVFCAAPDPDCTSDAGMDASSDGGLEPTDAGAPNDAPADASLPVGAWTTPVALTSGTLARSDLCVAQDRAGQAIAVWREEIRVGVHGVLASESSLTRSWGTALRVDPAEGGLHSPACDVAAGDALVAWWSWVPAPTSGRGLAEVWSRRRTAGAWEAAELEESFPEVMTPPQALASLDETGIGLLVLRRYWFDDGSTDEIDAIHVRRVGDTSWPLCSGGASDARCAPPRLAANSSGVRFVAFTDMTLTGVSGWIYPPGVMRSPTMRGSLGPPAVGPDGTIIVPTVRSGGGGQSVRTAVGLPSGGFGPELVHEVGSGLGTPAVAMGTTSEAWLVYGSTELRVARYAAATSTWEAPTTITSGLGHAAPTPSIAADASGRALIVWQDGVRGTVRAIRYTTATGWGTAETIETRDIVYGTVRLSLTPNGVALVGWIGADGQIWTSRSMM